MRQLEKPNSRLSRILPKTKTQKLILLGVVLAVVITIAGLIVRSTYFSPNSKVAHKVTKLDKTDVPCKEIREELGKDTDYNQYNKDTQKKLLEKQMICFGDNAEYDKAIPAAEKLKAIYQAENNEIRVKQTEAAIQAMQASQEQPEPINRSDSPNVQ